MKKIMVMYSNKKNETVVKEIDVTKVLIKTGVYTAIVLANPHTALAQSADLSHAFDPLLDTLKSLAKPLAVGFMTKGGLEVMSGNENKGKRTIKYAITGFIGIQWIPTIFDIIAKSAKTAGKF